METDKKGTKRQASEELSQDEVRPFEVVDERAPGQAAPVLHVLGYAVHVRGPRRRGWA